MEMKGLFSRKTIAFVAQWLEHWSCKPGVESSNLSEGFLLFTSCHHHTVYHTKRMARICDA